VSESRIDLQRVRRDIEAEVRARRAAGEYPPEFVRELDELFARFSPPEVSDDFDAALERAEEAVAIDPVVPTASNRRALGVVKRFLAKLLGWYHAFVAQQVTALGAALTHALRLLGNRVGEVERTTGGTGRARAEAARVVPARPDDEWQPAVLEALAGLGGRVAVCEAGDGALLAAIVAAGADAYGVEPRLHVADAAIARGLEVRLDDVAGHLRAVGEGELAAVVLRGCVERLPAGELLELADLALARLRPRGRLVVASLSPAGWGRRRAEIEADLSPGRPLHAATWEAILRTRGAADVVVRSCGTPPPLRGVPANHPDAAVLNDDLARISDALFAPEAYVVVATRPDR
jgi:hypothetical protein